MASFFEKFAASFNTISTATFDKLIYLGNKESNEVRVKYSELLKDPSFRTSEEVHDIMCMSASEARKALGIKVNN